ncbi:MAG: transglutaminase-like putative cysteine protease [Gammaproteobacteria bacterium]|jgi:transglutaminase-like putative cysteine protease
MSWLKADPELAGWHLSAGRLSWLSLSLALVVAPHVARLPVWITVLFAMMCLWRLWRVHLGDDRPPKRWWLVLIALAIIPAVYAGFGTVTGQQAGVAMLTLLAGIKLLETRGLRDAYVLSFLGFFLIITGFLFDQSLPTGVYMIAVIVVMTATLLSLGVSPGHSPAMGVAPHLRRAGGLVAQAVPLMLVLFVLFPRIPGPIWGLPKDANTAVTGLSDDMSPGNISSLSQSDAVAFRVRFDGRPPPVSQLYWRGPVLERTDGRRWTRGERVFGPGPVDLGRRGQPVDYEVSLEPHGKRWMFGLDLAVVAPRQAGVSRELELRARRDIHDRRIYRMRSYLDYALEPERPRARATALQLPADTHPQARALAKRWKAQLQTPQAIVKHALDWFRQQGFVYSLTPPLLLGDAVDEFLFGSREGFCEHYASAFVVMMRAAGIPSRVVTGYLGGEFNPMSDHMVVRQRDAHAWTEVWLQGAGWTRVDPTSAVSPTRIDQGIDAALPPTLGPSALGYTPSANIAGTLRQIRQAMDAVQTRWNAWVLGYGPERQREFLREFGLSAPGYGSMILALTVAITALLVATAVWMLYRRDRRDPLRTAYDEFCTKLARAGLIRETQEGPRDYADRVTRMRPELTPAVQHITDIYVQLRYARNSGSLDSLKREIAAFRP